MATTRRKILFGGAAALMPRMPPAQTREAESVRRIGVLMGRNGYVAHGYFADFVKGLRALGWHDDGNLRIEVRWAGGLRELYDQYAAELVSLMPGLIVAQSTPAVAALKRQTDTVPIVFNTAFAQRLPAVYPERSYADAGGLMSYGVSHDALYRGAAEHVDRILNGARPGDLPVQDPTKVEIVLNQRTAAALGVTFAPSLLAAADEVIE